MNARHISYHLYKNFRETQYEKVSKMRAQFKLAFMILIIWCLTNAAFPAFGSALRCGTRLITEGDTKSKVLAICGEPHYIDAWEEERTYRTYPWASHNVYYDNQHYEDKFLKPKIIKEFIWIEEWTYNHGPHRFMDHVRLEKGRVKKIVSGEFGY